MKLTVQKREITGKKVKHLRKGGVVPAAVYGPGQEPINLQIDEKVFKKTFEKAGFNKFVQLEIEGEKPVRVLIKDVQVHPIKDYTISISFYKIDEDRKISVDVPIEFVGAAPAEKQKLGFLMYQHNTVKLYCLPKDLPDQVTVSLESLDAPGTAVTASDIILPEGVEFDSSIGDPTASALVYVATEQKQLVEDTVVVAEEATAVEGAAKEEVKAE